MQEFVYMSPRVCMMKGLSKGQGSTSQFLVLKCLHIITGLHFLFLNKKKEPYEKPC